MIHPWDQDLLNAIWWMAGMFATATLLAAIAIGIQLALAYRAEMRIRHE